MTLKQTSLALLTLCTFLYCNSTNLQAKQSPPLEKTFIGKNKFIELCKKANKENWRAKPIGERTILAALAVQGTPYKTLTLEIYHFTESPSVNFNALDCWTLFETALGFARMLGNAPANKTDFAPTDLLKEIEITRYRGGICTGHYLSRIHYLVEWFFDNHARKNIINLTKELGGKRIKKDCNEMTTLTDFYPAMKKNPHFFRFMRALELRISDLPARYIPKNKVKNITKFLRNGDIIGIVTSKPGSYCSHVGLAYRTRKGVYLLHASSDFKKVLVDTTIEKYLKRYKKNLGIMVARPL